MSDLPSQGNVITIHLVPGHIDVWGNERADKLARLGSIAPFIETKTSFAPHPMLPCESRAGIYLSQWPQ